MVHYFYLEILFFFPADRRISGADNLNIKGECILSEFYWTYDLLKSIYKRKC